MLSMMHSRTSVMPRSLTHPGGVLFLDPSHRVSQEELDRRDARWRAMRERAYSRAWSEDATLVGSVRYYAATSSALRDWQDRALGRRGRRHQNQLLMITAEDHESSTIGRRQTSSEVDDTSSRSSRRPSPRRRSRISNLLTGKQQLKFKEFLRRWRRSY